LVILSDALQAAGKRKMHLISDGRIHRYQPSCVGGIRRLPLGSSMQSESQTSPSTFAYDVKMSAKTMSEKCTRWLTGEYMHLLMLLFFSFESPGEPQYQGQGQKAKTYRRNASRCRLCMTSYGESINIRITSAHTTGIYLKKSTREALP
jgi:hypothetical protein